MKLKHFDHDGRARFVTFCTHKKIPLLTNNKYREIIIDSISHVRSKAGFKLLGYVIMPEHVHLIVVPTTDSKIGLIIGDIKQRAAHRIIQLIKSRELLDLLTVNRDRLGSIALWQRRCYDHNCRTSESTWKKIAYCHENPVKRGLARDPADFLWSSSRWYEGMKNCPLEMDEY